MRKTKLFMMLAVAILTVGIFAGCSNGQKTGTTVKEDKQETTSKTDEEKGTETEDTGKTESADISKLFQNLDTVDFNGEKVTKDIFADKKLTLVNIWATWCGPCVAEIPELEALSEEYKDGEVGIKGLLVQIDEISGETMEGLTDEERAAADEILKSSKAAYQQLLVSKNIKDTLGMIQAFPTTYFVDKEGNIVGEPQVGSNTKEDWKKIIEERLDMVESK